jgi:CspA family cold shock protein
MGKAMPTGTVKMFKADRAFGFIKPDNPGSDVFFHINDVEGQQEPRPGQKVTFEVSIDKRSGREKATNVR